VLARRAAEELAIELDNSRREAERARDEAQRANRAKDEFLAMLGHELRNPLAPIFTALDLMRLRGGEAAKSRETDVIERQARHLAGLVDDLLDVSRITSGKIELKRQLLALDDVLAKAVETASPLFEKRRHELRLDVQHGLLVDGDPTRLVQVFANLLTNAAKYTDPGGVIEVTARRDDGSMLVEVRDNGRGISPEMLPKIFDLFAQESQNLDRAQGGLGLGLAIVKSLVSMHGGQVSARSAAPRLSYGFLPPQRSVRSTAAALHRAGRRAWVRNTGSSSSTITKMLPRCSAMRSLHLATRVPSRMTVPKHSSLPNASCSTRSCSTSACPRWTAMKSLATYARCRDGATFRSSRSRVTASRTTSSARSRPDSITISSSRST
jgi:signal transduction histidine kinase